MIETDRLRCEPLTAAHASVMYPVLSDERIYAYLPGNPPASPEALHRRYEFLSTGKSPDGRERWLNWILFLRQTGNPIGFYQATVRTSSCSIAYVLNPAFWRQGYASEASLTIVSQLFRRFDIPSVTAEIDRRNDASLALVQRLGFSFVRHDEAEGDDIYQTTRTSWENLHESSP